MILCHAWLGCSRGRFHRGYGIIANAAISGDFAFGKSPPQSVEIIAKWFRFIASNTCITSEFHATRHLSHHTRPGRRIVPVIADQLDTGFNEIFLGKSRRFDVIGNHDG